MTKTAPRTRMMRKAGIASGVAPTKAVKLADEGIVRAIVAVTGVVDNVNDLIVPGVFAESLRIRTPKVVEDHEWSRKVGRVLHVEEWAPGDPRLPKRTKEGRPWPEDAGALVATMQYILTTQEGRDAFERVKFYAESNEAEFSIGYKVPEGKAQKRSDGVRVIFGISLFEFSHVLFGAASLTTALEVKSLNGASAGTATLPALGDTKKVEPDDEDTPTPAPTAADPAPWDDDTEESTVESKTAYAAVLEAKGLAPHQLPAVEGKALSKMKGSYEERRQLIEIAARDLFEATYKDPCVCVVATYEHEVVVRLYLGDDEPSFVLPYTFADGAVSLGAPEPVELSLVAEPARDGATTEAEPLTVDDVAAVEPAREASDFLTTVISTFEASQSQERKDAAAALRAGLVEALGLEAKAAPENEETTDAAADAPPVPPAEDAPADEPSDEPAEDAPGGGFAAVAAPADEAPSDEPAEDEGTVTLSPDELHSYADEPSDAPMPEATEDVEEKAASDDIEPPAAEEATPADDAEDDPEGEGDTVTLDPDEVYGTIADLAS